MEPSDHPKKDLPFVRKRDNSNRQFNHFMVCGNLFECPARYEPINPVGKGAYGIVCSAKNIVTSERVAVKKIGNAFQNPVDAQRTLREIRILRHMNHENVVSIKDILPPLNRENFKDVYLVYELMDTDLHQLIRSPQLLSDAHIQYFIYQVLRGLKYIHSANILHRDLKPSNLLLNANCDLKICDFGLARASSEKLLMTEYVVTRWYRAPELLLSCTEYTAAIDMWSVGCILAELLGRKPLFPGKDYLMQLNLIMKVIGTPDEDDLQFVSSKKALQYVRSMPHHSRVDFSSLYPTANQLAIDLLERILVFDPYKRITVDEALGHPYLASLHDINDEPTCDSYFGQDGINLGKIEGCNDKDFIRSLIYEEMLSLNPDHVDDLEEQSGHAYAMEVENLP